MTVQGRADKLSARGGSRKHHAGNVREDEGLKDRGLINCLTGRYRAGRLLRNDSLGQRITGRILRNGSLGRLGTGRGRGSGTQGGNIKDNNNTVLGDETGSVQVYKIVPSSYSLNYIRGAEFSALASAIVEGTLHPLVFHQYIHRQGCCWAQDSG